MSVSRVPPAAPVELVPIICVILAGPGVFGMKGSCFTDYIPGGTAIILLQLGNRVGPSAGIPVEFREEYLSELGAACRGSGLKEMCTVPELCFIVVVYFFTGFKMTSFIACFFFKSIDMRSPDRAGFISL